MAKRRREPDSDGTTTTAETYNTVFIDTSLDTHLAMVAAGSDTVSDLKEKIVSEHGRCFPDIGEIKIHASKVKRKGYFYHLPDYMQVKSVFEGAKKSWFLYVDVSKHSDMQLIGKPDAGNQKGLLCIENSRQAHDQDDLPDDGFKTPSAVHEVEYLKVMNGRNSRREDFAGEVSKDIATEVGCNANVNCGDLSSDTSRSSVRRVQKFDTAVEKKTVPEAVPGFRDYKLQDDIRNVDYTSISQSFETENPAKKRKRRRTAIVTSSASKDDTGYIHGSYKDPSHLESGATVMDIGNKEDKKLLGSIIESVTLKDDHQRSSSIRNKTIKKRRKEVVKNHDQVAASVISSPLVEGDRSESGKVIASLAKDDATALEDFDVVQDVNNNTHHSSHQDSIPANKEPEIEYADKTEGERKLTSVHDPEEVLTEKVGHLRHSRVVKSGESTLPSTLPDVEKVTAHSKSDRKKRVKMSRSRFQDEHVDHSKNAITDIHSVLPSIADNDQQSRESIVVEENDLSLKHTPENELPGKCRSSDQVDASIEDPNLATKSFAVRGAIEDGNSGKKKIKKKAKKSAAKVLEAIDMNLDNDKMNGVFCSSALNPAANMSNDMRPNECLVPHSETNLAKQNEKIDLLLDDNDMTMLARCRHSDREELNVIATGTVFTTNNANVVEEQKMSTGRKKKSSRKAAMAVCEDASDMGRAVNCASHSSPVELLCPITLTAETKEKAEDIHENNLLKSRHLGGNNIQDAPPDEQANKIEGVQLDEASRIIENKIMYKKTKRNETSAANNHVNQKITASSDRLKTADAPSGEQGKEEENKLLNPSNESYENTENSGRKSKKKMKKNQVTSANSHSSLLPIEDQIAVQDVVDMVASNERLTKVETPTKEPESLVHMPLDSSKGMQDNTDIKKRKKSTRGPCSSEAGSHSNLSIKDQSFGEDIAALNRRLMEQDSPSRTRNTGSMMSPSSHLPVSDYQKNNEATQCKGDQINFKQYFVPNQHQDEISTQPGAESIAEKKTDENVVPSLGIVPKGSVVSSADKVQKSTQSNKGTKIKKKMEKHGIPYATTSSDLKEIKTLAVASDILNKTMPCSKQNDKYLPGSSLSSSSEGSEKLPLGQKSGLRHHVVTVTRTSSMLGGEVVNSSTQAKGLARTPSAIFRDVSSESSGDENGSVDSGASTRTPSDNSSSSGFSVDGSDLSEDSTRNGTNGVKSKVGSRKNILNPEFSGPRQIPMDTIFRSSSRFKKAKLTAALQFEDTESQPDEFVPDSLPYQ